MESSAGLEPSSPSSPRIDNDCKAKSKNFRLVFRISAVSRSEISPLIVIFHAVFASSKRCVPKFNSKTGSCKFLGYDRLHLFEGNKVDK